MSANIRLSKSTNKQWLRVEVIFRENPEESVSFILSPTEATILSNLLMEEVKRV